MEEEVFQAILEVSRPSQPVFRAAVASEFENVAIAFRIEKTINQSHDPLKNNNNLVKKAKLTKNRPIF